MREGHAVAEKTRARHGVDALVGTCLPTTTCLHAENGKACGKGAVLLSAVLETKPGANPSGCLGPVDIIVCTNPEERHVMLARPTEGFGYKDAWYYKGICVERSKKLFRK